MVWHAFHFWDWFVVILLTLQGSSVDAVPENKANEELKKVKEELQTTKDDLNKAKADLTSIKKQAEGVNLEYDRLLKEHTLLQVGYWIHHLLFSVS